MPGLYHSPLRRRDFLRISSLAGAALVMPGCHTSPGVSGASGSEIHLALLSDTHINMGVGEQSEMNFAPARTRHAGRGVAARHDQGGPGQAGDSQKITPPER